MRMRDVRQMAASRDPGRVEALVDELIARARTDLGAVVAEARKRGLPVEGPTAAAQVASLRALAPAALDPVAAAFVRTNSLAAGAQGFVVGVGGLATLPLTLGADTVGTLYWIVRATSGVMASYGFETESAQGAALLRMGLLAATGVNAFAVDGSQLVVAEVSRQLLVNPASPRLIAAGTRHLLRRLGVGAARGRLSRAVPVIGGAVGGATNAAMVQAVGRRSRGHYRALLVEWQARQHAALLRPPPHLPPPPPAALEP